MRLSSAPSTPLCRHFGACGGCQLQDISYTAQLRLKADRLHSLLGVPKTLLPEIQLHPSPPYAYRNRVRFTLREVSGDLRIGYLQRSHPPANDDANEDASGQIPHEEQVADLATPLRFLPIEECPIAAPLLWRTAAALLTLAHEDRSAASWLVAADQLEIFTDATQSSIQFTLFVRPPANSQAAAAALPGLFSASPPPRLAKTFSAFCETAKARIPELTGAGVLLLPPASTSRSRRAEHPRPGPAWGSAGLVYKVAERKVAQTAYWVPRGAFFQVNRFLLPDLIAIVTHHAGQPRRGALAWDLYAGVGLFSRCLARGFDEVVAVEIADPAAVALASTGLRNLHPVKATTLDFLRAAVLQRERPELIVLDPPRSGAGPEIAALLGRIATPTLIYVSCSPDTLSADLAVLRASGYALTELHLIDLFPQTSHIETVAILHR